MKSPTLPTAYSITRQQALGYVTPKILDDAIAAGKVKKFPTAKIVWFRLHEILELNKSLTEK